MMITLIGGEKVMIIDDSTMVKVMMSNDTDYDFELK